jgi:hypothetical protein
VPEVVRCLIAIISRSSRKNGSRLGNCEASNGVIRFTYSFRQAVSQDFPGASYAQNYASIILYSFP